MFNSAKEFDRWADTVLHSGSWNELISFWWPGIILVIIIIVAAAMSKD